MPCVEWCKNVGSHTLFSFVLKVRCVCMMSVLGLYVLTYNNVVSDS